jgi:arsenite methyltransferase
MAEDLNAYVGCIAGAILIEDYRKGLVAAGLSHVQVIESGKDLNAYAKMENSSSSWCGSPEPAPKAKKKAATSCCCSSSVEEGKSEIHSGLKDVLQRYNVNDYAASVKVFAVKPKESAESD